MLKESLSGSAPTKAVWPVVPTVEYCAMELLLCPSGKTKIFQKK